jgi:hypothetical protein
MKLKVVGDEIWSDEGYLIASFNQRLLPTKRATAEQSLFFPATETDWDLQQRCFDQQDKIAELEAEIERLRTS